MGREGCSGDPATPGVCEVWWASPSDARPGLRSLLPPSELARVDRLRRCADRDRALVGAALSRVLLARELAVEPAAVRLSRTCRCGQEHGKPRLAAGTGPDVSVSHSGDNVVVALVRGGDVGVDVEVADGRTGPPASGLLRLTTTPAERALVGNWTRAAFLRTWVRKEAVVKATGDGLTVSFAGFAVTAPDRLPVLLGWPSDPDLPARLALTDLTAADGTVGAVAVLGPRRAPDPPTGRDTPRPERPGARIVVVEHDGSSLLDRA